MLNILKYMIFGHVLKHTGECKNEAFEATKILYEVNDSTVGN